ncbi:L domain-like protein [Xylariaceae sp. FL0255]|nr:L domain-like protein [Xylariaceae sp. FL0255]
MEEKRSGGASTPGGGGNGNVSSYRQSNIPKPSSRLPLPRSNIPNPSTPTRGLRKIPTPSVENLRAPPSTTTSSLRNPRLRPAASREQLNSPRPQRPDALLTSSQTSQRDSRARNGSLSQGSPQRPSQSQTAVDSTFKRPLAPRRRPSSQLSHAAQLSMAVPEDGLVQDSSPTDYTSEHPPLPQPTEENLTFESLAAKPFKPRPSLSERTVQTLSNIPSSPALKRRGSSFFETAGTRRPQSKGSSVSRPGSSYQSDEHGRPQSRPGSSSDPLDTDSDHFRTSISGYKPPLPTVRGTPTKQSSGFGYSTTPANKGLSKTNPRASLSKVPSLSSLNGPIDPRSPSPIPRFKSNTVVTRSVKPRGSLSALFRKPSMPTVKDASLVVSNSARKVSAASATSPRTSDEDRNPSGLSYASTAPTVHSVDEQPPTSARKSSTALRDQIAKAKAAKRAAGRQVSSTVAPATEPSFSPTADNFDFGLSDDPFGQKKFVDSNRKVLQSRINTGRTTGRLNIAAMGLTEIPDEVLKMYDLDSTNGSWAESVDLTRLVAADNELQTIDDTIFPDIDPNDAAFEEVDDRGRMFWGLESADLHNNMLISLPLGMRRLELLTSLNLASNKLTNNALETIAQCKNLRDLKLSNNLLYGAIGDFFVLENLESLDIHGNNVSALPLNLESMKRLRIINLDENNFESLPFNSLAALPLSELTARKNRLGGTLIDGQVRSLSQLQILDCSGNQLTYLFPPDSNERLALPSLHQLTVSMNRLKSLPDMTYWNNILTINADDNSITAFPDGFVSRETLRHAGFSSNDIRVIPPEIARMDSLVMLRITGNPLRDKKFTSFTTEQLKDALLARLEPLPGNEMGSIEHFANGIDSFGTNTLSSHDLSTAPLKTAPAVARNDDDDDDERSDLDDFATPPTSAPNSPERVMNRGRSQTLSNQTWPIKAGGILDRSNTQSSSLHPVVCSKLAAVESVREIRLQHNIFTQFPNSLSFFSDTLTSLTLSNNQLTGESWLTEQLDLTALKELNLQSNFCTSLTPLTTHLCAPNLEKLDVSLNRIVRLPALRDIFPSLVVLLISNNRLEELDPNAVQGMKIVDASNNEIAHLNPRLGLLALERLEVMGNRFRVPRWNVLERGSEATLRWLRCRVPVAEMAEWRAKTGSTEEEYDGTD